MTQELTLAVEEMQKLQKECTGKDGVWLSVCSSGPGKQGQFGADQWNKMNEEKKVAATAVLLDEDGAVGKKFGARTTPHMFVIDPQGKLIYQGAIDSNHDQRPGRLGATTIGG